MIKSFSVRRENLTIKGKMFLPDRTEDRYPAVIISHEFGSNMISTARYAKKISKYGVCAFIFDFCGSGSGISQGKSTDMSVLTEKDDLEAVFEYVRNLDFINENHISLMGCSQGGLVSALLAAERQENIEKLILCYPALCIPDDARKGSMLGSEFEPENLPDKFVALYVKLGRKYIEDALSLDPWKEICSFSKPVLLLHGDKDGIVPFRYAESAAGKYPDCTLVKIRNAKHLFPTTACIKANEAILEFLK